MPRTDDCLAVVTGAAGTMGQAITRQLVADGHRVVAADLKTEPLSALLDEMPGRVTPLALDIADPEAVERAWNELNVAQGAVQILVNNAGVLSNNKAIETSPEEWRQIMAVNLDGPFYLSRLGLRDMRKAGWGRIVNICSLSMKTGGLTAGTAYAASKGGLGVLTFSLARESASQGITVNGIAPGYVLTPMVTEQLTEAQRQAQLRDIPVGRFCKAEEVAHCVSYLVGANAGFITGEIIDMNGGMLMD
ncbi:MAG TPA: SDR family NAD(P)-dependent oxidoreductase [Mesorhizobium sp.]|jgi:3-oxoacyl-[acyl-carrier protein] reductase|nr:SDR family NAD(P)-dependent oxidoreductase [Mesorhizobium sp.]